MEIDVTIMHHNEIDAHVNEVMDYAATHWHKWLGNSRNQWLYELLMNSEVFESSLSIHDIDHDTALDNMAFMISAFTDVKNIYQISVYDALYSHFEDELKYGESHGQTHLQIMDEVHLNNERLRG